jgi:16S rRNA (cytosine967-C5)-methyltransferase
MRMAGRVAAAIEILNDVFTQHRPSSEALKDWGKSHRFAGSTDRHAIGTMVYDVLRRRETASSRMGDGRPRALVLGALRDVWNMPAAEIETLCTELFGPGVLTAKEKAALERFSGMVAAFAHRSVWGACC